MRVRLSPLVRFESPSTKTTRSASKKKPSLMSRVGGQARAAVSNPYVKTTAAVGIASIMLGACAGVAKETYDFISA